jgi:hypothetical protein
VSSTRCGSATTRIWVELLKDTVPACARSWDPVARQWTINAEFASLLASAIGRRGHHTVGLNAEPDRSRWAEMLFDRVGPDPPAVNGRCAECHIIHVRVMAGYDQ